MRFKGCQWQALRVDKWPARFAARVGFEGWPGLPDVSFRGMGEVGEIVALAPALADAEEYGINFERREEAGEADFGQGLSKASNRVALALALSDSTQG